MALAVTIPVTIPGLRTDGSVVCWGEDDFGQASLPKGSFASVDAGWYLTCGVMTDGSVACRGSNKDGGGAYTGQAAPPE